MNCERMSTLLNAYADHELTGHEMQEVRCHLRACPACREELAQMESVKRLVGRLAVEESSVSLAELRARVFEPTPARRRVRSAVWLGAGLAAAVTFFGLWVAQTVSEPVIANESTRHEPAQTDLVYVGGTDALGGYAPTLTVAGD
jgi:anti-sigma factor RsiW